ncbi:ankyrin repeat-containing protein [Cucumis melo var. makuwa]|uniref:Ankyrin repeat-containing protein n=1 Tax=Cucumis melo var. makuwa TaxID=1194695 RepID=A0A5A7UHI9_CUCMM|nr:ankyrin repeat-containing protein [Cucumis melo var. makuwa]
MGSSVLTSDDHISYFPSSSRSQTTDNSVADDVVIKITDEQENIKNAVKLHQAALKGDWEAANDIFKKDTSWITKKITIRENTALHIAAAAKHISFVEKLVKLYSSNDFDLAIKNRDGRPALAYAAISGIVRIAETIVDNDHKLRDPVDDAHLKYLPLLSSVFYKLKDMASYLFSQTNFDALQTTQQLNLLLATVDSDYYDIALDILKKKPELAKERVEENGETALHLLARKPNAIGSSNKLCFWKKYINSRFNRIYRTAVMQTLAHQVVERLWNFVVENLSTFELHKLILTPSNLLLDAASVGNVEFLIILIRSYPDLLWMASKDNKTIFHVAVENRQGNVFSLIHEIGGVKNYLGNGYNEKNDCNILHLAGKLASPYHLNKVVSGKALQMQYELRWFKEVEKIVIPSHYEMKMKNEHGDRLTPRELFTKEHKHLRREGEEWMKNTANSCMLVAALIATVVFAAAFTVPGGNEDKDGIPIFQKNQLA